MKLISRYIACMTVAFAVAYADQPTVYPTPQKMQMTGGTTRVKTVEVKPLVEIAPGVSPTVGAYKLIITPGKLVVQVPAGDDDALYYAKQTLSQLLLEHPEALNMQKDPYPGLSIEEVAKLGKLPLGEVNDWPDLPYRGVVEGYYGTPWTKDARCSLFDFYGRNKMNAYIYAPKDDPYHHGRGCYELYPAEKAAEIREMVRHARKNHVRFIWAIHPANTVQWQDNGGKTQLDALCAKLQAMYDLGVRDFGVLVDDSSGEIGKPERQVQLCNYLMENFVRKHPDVTQTLIMCPTGYNRSWTSEKFLRSLGGGLLPEIPVMWTGNTVVCNITLSGQRWVKESLGRPTFIWWNWPCSDFKRNRLSMGRAYGLDTSAEMKSLMSGFVANPMEQAEANKVGLFGVADYTWNICAFDSVKSWKSGIVRLYPQDAEAMQVFCNHNSYLLPNGHGLFREESAEIMDDVQKLVKSLEADAPDKKLLGDLRAEYQRMQQAGKSLGKSEHLGALRDEIAPWFRQFELAGAAAVESIDALTESKVDKRLAHLFAAMGKLAAMKQTTRMEWNGGKPKPVADVEVGMYVMTPVMKSIYRQAANSVYSQMAGRKVATPKFIIDGKAPERVPDALDDDNMRTAWDNGARQREGESYALDFGSVIEMRRINLQMGGQRANDYAERFVLEYSTDGSKWTPLGKECEGPGVTLDLAEKPVQARMLRFRITKPRPNWLSICEFSVNHKAEPMFIASRKQPEKMPASMSDDDLSTFWDSGAYQQVGDCYGIDFGTSVKLSRINLLMGGPRANDYAAAGQFEISDDGKKWTPVGKECSGASAVLDLRKSPVRAKMLRYRITKNRPNWLTICEFSVNSMVSPYVSQNLAMHPNFGVYKSGNSLGINRVMEVMEMRAGEYIELNVPSFITPEWLEIDLDNDELTSWATIEFTLQSGKRVPVKGDMAKSRLYLKSGLPQEPVRSLRVTNSGNKTQQIKLTQFAMGVEGTDEPQSADLVLDGDLTTVIACDTPVELAVPVPAGKKKAIVVGTADYEVVSGAARVEKGAYRGVVEMAKGAKKLRIRAKAQSGKFISEIIFK